MATKKCTGSCHCGKVRFEADIDFEAGTGKCNCSICQKSRNWSIGADYKTFAWTSGEDALTDYQWNLDSIHNYFCKHCGVRLVGKGTIPEMGEFCSIQVVTIDGLSDEELAALPVKYSNGRDNNWWHEPAITSYL